MRALPRLYLGIGGRNPINAMRTITTLLILVALLCGSPVVSATVLEHTAHLHGTALPGGPPSMRLAGLSKGAITQAVWAKTTTVELAGCVPDARVTSLTVCIQDCKGKADQLSTKGDRFTPAMKTMIANLPAGTPFIVKVTVVDGSGKTWTVPDATYVTAH